MLLTNPVSYTSLLPVLLTNPVSYTSFVTCAVDQSGQLYQFCYPCCWPTRSVIPVLLPVLLTNPVSSLPVLLTNLVSYTSFVTCAADQPNQLYQFWYLCCWPTQSVIPVCYLCCWPNPVSYHTYKSCWRLRQSTAAPFQSTAPIKSTICHYFAQS